MREPPERTIPALQGEIEEVGDAPEMHVAFPVESSDQDKVPPIGRLDVPRPERERTRVRERGETPVKVERHGASEGAAT
jgi:hypothetical protein